MTDNKEQISRYHLEENLLIGCRDGNTLFWLKTNNIDLNSKVDRLDIVEAGKAWIDEKSDTTILDFPTKDKEELNQLANEFLQSNDRFSEYVKSDFYVQLVNCERRIPIEFDHQSIDYINHDYDLPDHMEGYILDEDTFIRKNTDTGKFDYFKFSNFTMNDFKFDRFGWVKAARKYFSYASDEDLFSELKGYTKESSGKAWIDKKNNILVLGPIVDQEPDNIDNFFIERVHSYLKTYSKWNQTQYWIDIESGLKDNPFDKQAFYFAILDKYMM